MPTLREAQEAEAKRVAEAKARDESFDHRDDRYVADARKDGIRNLTAEEYQRVASMVAVADRSVLAGWPLDAPAMFNGSPQPCDMWTGPCACGAWHTEGV